jgi:rare lipoprotein A (peptidoglycan hydrolase)
MSLPASAKPIRLGKRTVHDRTRHARYQTVSWLVSAGETASERCPMTNMDIAKQIAAVALVVLLGAAWALGIALAEEGIAIFYGDKFQEKKTAGGEVYDKYAADRGG